MTRLEFHPDALAEFEASVEYYELRQAGLGNRFISSVDSALHAIRTGPTMSPVLEQDVRRRLTRVFPYAILYSIEPDYILVLAVMHCHRQPGYWRARA